MDFGKHLWGTMIALGGMAQAEVIFQDTFDRPDSGEVNQSVAGITDNTLQGLQKGSVWATIHNGTLEKGWANNIKKGRLRLANRTMSSSLMLNYNMIDAKIVESGGFTVEFTVSPGSILSSCGTGVGFAMGMTSKEARETGDAWLGGGIIDWQGNPSKVRGKKLQDGIWDYQFEATNKRKSSAVSDFWLVLSGLNDEIGLDAKLSWGGYGDSVHQKQALSAKYKTKVVDAGIAGGTIKVNFEFGDFDAGSRVRFEIFFEDDSVGTGSFLWSDKDSNYLAFDARGPVQYVDNFKVSTLQK